VSLTAFSRIVLNAHEHLTNASIKESVGYRKERGSGCKVSARSSNEPPTYADVHQCSGHNRRRDRGQADVDMAGWNGLPKLKT